MKLNSLTAISPIDGRYSKSTLVLREIFSEFGFFKYRLNVEIQWFKKIISICDISMPPNKKSLFRDVKKEQEKL